MDGGRTPNEQLTAVMAEAGMSNKGLAARVCAEADLIGLAVSYDHGSVRGWLKGVRPRAETIPCIAAALSKKLGRPVTPSEIGFEDEEAENPDQPDIIERGTEYQEQAAQAVGILDRLTNADLAANTTALQAPWSADTASRVITGYLFSAPLWSPSDGPAFKGSESVAERIRSTLRSITQLDFQFGGGHVRTMLLSYWKSEVLPELRRGYPAAVRRELFAAAADAAEVLGWSAYDAGHHGTAQRYFIQGLRLAREADDAMMAGQILSNLSHQANYLGQFDSALHLARAAQSATTRRATATVRTMFLSMEARALASMGDRHGCMAAISEAEREFAVRDTSTDPAWIEYFDEFELAGEVAHCFRDLGLADETLHFAGAAIDAVRTPPRTRAFISMVTATGELHAGNLDAALALACDSVQLAGPVRSDRYRKYLRDFYGLIQGRKEERATQEFCALLDAHHPTIVRR
jgi:hypothetical protein